MIMTFKVKVSKSGDFKLPVATPSHCDETMYRGNIMRFKIDARKLSKLSILNHSLFSGGHFNTTNLPDQMTIVETSYIPTVRVSI